MTMLDDPVAGQQVAPAVAAPQPPEPPSATPAAPPATTPAAAPDPVEGQTVDSVESQPVDTDPIVGQQLPVSLRAPTTPQEYAQRINDPDTRYTVKKRPGLAWGAFNADTPMTFDEMYRHFVPTGSKQRLEILQNVATREATNGDPGWQAHQDQVNKLKHDLVKEWVGKFDPTAFPEDAAAAREQARQHAESRGVVATSGSEFVGKYLHNAGQLGGGDNDLIIRQQLQHEAQQAAHPTAAAIAGTAGSILAPESLAAMSAGGGVGAVAGTATKSALVARTVAQAAQGAGQAFTTAGTEDRLPTPAEVGTNVIASVAGGAAAHGVAKALPFAERAAHAGVAGDLGGKVANMSADWATTASANAAAMVATNKAAAAAQGHPYTTQDAARDFAMGLALEPAGRLAGAATHVEAHGQGPVATFADEAVARKFVADNPQTTYAGRAPTGEHVVVPAAAGEITPERLQESSQKVQQAQEEIRQRTGAADTELRPVAIDLPKYAQDLGDRLGLKIHWYQSNKAGEDGHLQEGFPDAVDLGGGHVAVDVSGPAGDALARVAHEFVHELRRQDAQSYGDLASLAQKVAPGKFDESRADYAARYQKQFGKSIDPALAHEEGVADFLKTMMSEQKFKYLTRRNPSLTDRLGGFVRRLLGVAARPEDNAANMARSAVRFRELVEQEGAHGESGRKALDYEGTRGEEVLGGADTGREAVRALPADGAKIGAPTAQVGDHPASEREDARQSVGEPESHGPAAGEGNAAGLPTEGHNQRPDGVDGEDVKGIPVRTQGGHGEDVGSEVAERRSGSSQEPELLRQSAEKFRADDGERTQSTSRDTRAGAMVEEARGTLQGVRDPVSPTLLQRSVPEVLHKGVPVDKGSVKEADGGGAEAAPFSLFHRPITGGESGDLFKDRPLPERPDGRPHGDYTFLKALTPEELRTDLADLAQRNASGSRFVNRPRNSDTMAAMRRELFDRGESVLDPEQMKRWGLTDSDVRLAEPHLGDALTPAAVYGVKRAIAGQGMKSIEGMTAAEAKDAHRAWKAARLGQSDISRQAAENPQNLTPEERSERERIQKNQTGETGKLFSLAGGATAVDDAPPGGSMSLWKKIKDHLPTIDPLPRLSAVSDEAALAANAHATSREAAPFIARDLVAKFMAPADYKDPAAREKFGRWMTTDQVLGIYYQNKDRAAQLREQAQELEAGQLTGEVDADKIQSLLKRADAAEESARAVDTKVNVKEVTADLKRELAEDPKLQSQVESYKSHVQPYLDRQFNILRGVDPATENQHRGQISGAHFPLIDLGGDTLLDRPEPDAESPKGAKGSLKVGKDKFNQRASGLGNYQTDPEAVLQESVGRRWPEVTKIALIDALKKAGVAEVPESSAGAPVRINGRVPYRQKIVLPRTEENGHTHGVERVMYLDPHVAREVDRILDSRDLPQHAVLRALTMLQMASLNDVTFHAKNIALQMAHMPGGKSVAEDLVRKIPGIQQGAAAAEAFGIMRDLRADSPDMRAELRKMAERGLLRSEHPETGIQALTKSSKMLHVADTVGRVMANRHFDNLVERKGGLGAVDSEANRRNFVSQLGNYNKRTMSALARHFRDLGISPFVVAGLTMNRNALRSITGNPGYEARTAGGAAAARAIQWAGPAAMVSMVGLINAAITGSPFGRSGVPLGSIDLGVDDAKGKHRTFDALGMTFARRGLRLTGLNAGINGTIAGQDANQIGGDMFSDMVQSQLHPWIGPGPGAVIAGITGRRLDTRGTLEAQKIPEGGLKQNAENLRAAIASQNPLLYGLGRAVVNPVDRALGNPLAKSMGYPTEGGSLQQDATDVLGSLVQAPLSALQFKNVSPAKDAAERTAATIAAGKFPDAGPNDAAAGKAGVMRSLVESLRSGKEDAMQRVHDAVTAGDISEKDVPNLLHRSAMSELQWKVSHLSGADAAKVYDAATDQEKDQLRDTVIARVAKDNTISSADRAAMLKKLGGSPEEAGMVSELADLEGAERAERGVKDRIGVITQQIAQATAVGDGAGAQRLRRQRQALASGAGGRKVNAGRLKRLRALRGRVGKLRKQAASGSLPKAVAAKRIRETLAAAG